MKTIKKIENAINRLSSGKRIHNNTFKKLVGDASYKEYLRTVEAYKKPEQMPYEIRKYIKLLKTACYYESVADRYGGKYANKADSAYEYAWEYAREIVKTNPAFSLWFDRSVFGNATSARSAIPRVIGGRSFYCKNRNKKPIITTTIEIKLGYLSSRREELSVANLENWLCDMQPIPDLIKKSKKLDFSEFIF